MQTTVLKHSPRILGLLSRRLSDKPTQPPLLRWLERRRKHRQRQAALARLRAQPDYLLQDIGLSRDDIRLVRSNPPIVF